MIIDKGNGVIEDWGPVRPKGVMSYREERRIAGDMNRLISGSMRKKAEKVYLCVICHKRVNSGVVNRKGFGKSNPKHISCNKYDEELKGLKK